MPSSPRIFRLTTSCRPRVFVANPEISWGVTSSCGSGQPKFPPPLSLQRFLNDRICQPIFTANMFSDIHAVRESVPTQRCRGAKTDAGSKLRSVPLAPCPEDLKPKWAHSPKEIDGKFESTLMGCGFESTHTTPPSIRMMINHPPAPVFFYFHRTPGSSRTNRLFCPEPRI